MAMVSNSLRLTPILSDKVHISILSTFPLKQETQKHISIRAARSPRLPVLPPGITRERINFAIAVIQQKLGGKHVQIIDSRFNAEFGGTEIRVMHSTCRARSSNLIRHCAQTIVHWANADFTLIWPISMGRNLCYGGAAPHVRGSVAVDLGKRMNKVLNIDHNSASCMVEPGVSYFKLYYEVWKSGYPPMIDPPDLGGGALWEMPLGNYYGLEVVLPNGEVLRTGIDALPGKNGTDNPSWQAFQPVNGSYSDGNFRQSNFGIVKNMGIWLNAKTFDSQSYMITFPDDNFFVERRLFSYMGRSGPKAAYSSTGLCEGANAAKEGSKWRGNIWECGDVGEKWREMGWPKGSGEEVEATSWEGVMQEG
ncbi:hypothetical protein BDZ91DRAFT_764862 [Kalaharituber pfeilii]|nr:hypothetical protein BDZ91DRAFT_764862 [Kalaharituber pfeilii]